MWRGLLAVIALTTITNLHVATGSGEKRFRYLLQPEQATTSMQIAMEETAVVGPHDINVILEQTGLWWMRYSAQSDQDRCELHEQVEMHDLTRNLTDRMAIDGALPGCVTRGPAPAAPATQTRAVMPPSIASAVSGPLADAAAVQPFARIAFTRLAPLVAGSAPPPPPIAKYRVQQEMIDCDSDARHGTPCPPDSK